jgi:hypothetical protein
MTYPDLLDLMVHYTLAILVKVMMHSIGGSMHKVGIDTILDDAVTL